MRFGDFSDSCKSPKHQSPSRSETKTILRFQGVFPILPGRPSLPAKPDFDDAETTERRLDCFSDGRKLTRSVRCAYGLMSCGLFALLTIAAQLSPATEGLGTHRQLGLPGCTWMEVWGVRCPSCGMTTSWSLAMRGDWVAAARANPAGLLLFFQAWITAFYWAWASVRGTSYRSRWFAMGSVGLMVVALVVAIADWLWKLTV
ncbi:hypothetical protein VN12_17165 [Pirellula sp. SH-Sr6A]|nr:hypothetical protein VN12_17165 [Pirellula sp. SH-Sr6A]